MKADHLDERLAGSSAAGRVDHSAASLGTMTVVQTVALKVYKLAGESVAKSAVDWVDLWEILKAERTDDWSVWQTGQQLEWPLGSRWASPWAEQSARR